MKRFVLSVPPGPEGIIRLYEKDYHYLVRVRRLRPGACFDALLPGGKETRVRVLSTVDNILIGECTGATEKIPSSFPRIALFQGLPRGAKMDLIVRQAAEGGVFLIIPFVSEYSAARPESGSAERQKRWERIIREARQQSGSVIETEVKEPCGFDSMLEYWEALKKEYSSPAGILLHQEPLEQGSFHDYLCNNPDFIALAVGPEGGFSPGEVTGLIQTGFKPVLMGNTILRTETAAIYGTAAIRVILLERETWTSKESCSSRYP